MCLIGKTQLLCMQCRGIGPHLIARGKSHGFSRVAAGTCCILSSYGGDGHLKLGFVQRSQDSCLVYDGHLGKLNYAWHENTYTSVGEPGGQASLMIWHSYIGIPINFHQESGIVTFLSIELSTPLEVSNGCEALSPEELENYGFLYGLYRGLRHPFIL